MKVLEISHLMRFILVFITSLLVMSCGGEKQVALPIQLTPSATTDIEYQVTGTLTKRLTLAINNPAQYASLSVYANKHLIIDSLNIPKKGEQTINAMVKFKQLGPVKLTLVAKDSVLTINQYTFSDINELSFIDFQDSSIKAGLDKANSIKYGGPTVADIDNDGDYDLIVNNHNAEPSKLYWNNGDGSVSKHGKDLARWFMHDLHGTAAGDYDNDGDLDLVVTMGGGNGKNPSKANFYQNKNGTLVLKTGDVGIDKGGRGRGAKFVDMDLDGDLDLMLINEASLDHAKPQHFFYKNLGDGRFTYTPVEGLQDQEPSRALITDVNNDHIDDVILYSPLSIWQGNGDFTYTNTTEQLPEYVAKLHDVMAIADIDIDNDGDQDLYLARGKVFENGFGEAPSVDHDPISQEFSIKPRGFKGVDEFEFVADGAIKFYKYKFLTQGTFRDKDYPIFLGANKTSHILDIGESLDILPTSAQGWPDDISENGVYFGYLGNGKWKSALVRNGNIFWTFRFSLAGVKEVTLGFEPENRNIADILLRNDNGKFTDVSKKWNVPTGGNALGVTVGDFNNDSLQDLFVYRWGQIGARISDFVLLNNGSQFEITTMHGANDVGGPGNGDMGQAFDFDLDGDIDLLNGSEDGQWYLYENTLTQPDNTKPNKTKPNKTKLNDNHYALVRVGYSPKDNVDAISAQVIVKTPTQEYRKLVGSAGAVFSQSLLNIVHFGLGKEDTIESITVRWRNGESHVFSNKKADQLFDTNKVDPTEIDVEPATLSLRENATKQLIVNILPNHADKSLLWQSSEPQVVSVNENGVIHATGRIGETATITAKSSAKSVTNKLAGQSKVTIVPWFAKPLQKVALYADTTELIAGDNVTIKATLIPDDADDKTLIWTSSQPNVASVNAKGKVTTHQQGQAVIEAVSAKNNQIAAQVSLTVAPLIKPYIEITNAAQFQDKPLVVGEKFTVKVNYHAGSGNKVIASDEGGIRFLVTRI